jgi:hypothetical protein
LRSGKEVRSEESEGLGSASCHEQWKEVWAEDSRCMMRIWYSYQKDWNWCNTIKMIPTSLHNTLGFHSEDQFINTVCGRNAETVGEPEPIPCGGWVEYLHRSPASRRRRWKWKSRIWNSKISSRVPRD